VKQFNYFFPDRVQVWLVCDDANDFEFDEIVVDDEVGESTETEDGHLDWFAYETSHGEGLDGLLDLIAFDRQERLAWLAEHGIAPGQRFQVEIEKPTYSGPDYWGEYDWSAGDWRIVQIEPWPLRKILRAWTKQSDKDATRVIELATG
jgi:hypothetical protein